MMDDLKGFFSRLRTRGVAKRAAEGGMVWFLVTGILLTVLLGGVVYGQVSILQNGREIVLKTAPVDPRDLFRGYYVRLNYDVSSLNGKDVRLPEKVRRNQRVYVALEEKKGPKEKGRAEWKAVAASLDRQALPRNAVIVRGRARYGYQRKNWHSVLALHYGIEKYFVPPLFENES